MVRGLQLCICNVHLHFIFSSYALSYSLGSTTESVYGNSTWVQILTFPFNWIFFQLYKTCSIACNFMCIEIFIIYDYIVLFNNCYLYILYRYTGHAFLRFSITHMGAPFSLMGMLEMDDHSGMRPRLILNLALRAGSSKQGKARRASVDWNWVVAITLKYI